MTVPALRVGLAGFGLAGEAFHAPLIAATDGLEVAAVVTRDPARAQRARAAHPDVRVAASMDELWAGELDLLVVAAPNRAHAPLARDALARGVPVVVDKPLAPSAAEAEAVVAAAHEAKVGLTVFQNRRWDGDFLTARRLVRSGELGEVVRFASRFERFRPAIKDGWRELADPAEGGGTLLDLGSHLVDQARVLFGAPRRVYAEVGRRRPGARADDDAFVALEHDGGVHAHLWMSAVAPLHGPRLAVSGLRAGFATEGLDVQEAQLREGRRPGDPGFGEAGVGRLVDEDGERLVALVAGRYVRFYEGVRDWLRGAAPAPVDPRDAVEVLRVLEAARRSAETRTVVELA